MPTSATNISTNTHTHNLSHQIICTPTEHDSATTSLITDPENQWHQLAECYTRTALYNWWEQLFG